MSLIPMRAAHGAGVVGNGTAASCTEAAFNTALTGGGVIMFDCGSAPTTIAVSARKMIAVDTHIKGGGVITISGGNATGIFGVSAGVTFTLSNLTIANANSRDLGSPEPGGGIDNEGGNIVITGCTFSGNAGERGGGIYNDISGTLTVTDSTFANNDGPDGGGAIEMVTGTLTATNSTFVGNSSDDDGGAIDMDGDSGMVTNCTFSGNTTSAGRGAALDVGNGYPVTITVQNSILANNAPGTFSCSVDDPDEVIDGGHNLDDDGSCGFLSMQGSLSNTPAGLDPAGLASNGGLTQTVALCTGANTPASCTGASAAINAGDPTICAAIGGVDQRHDARPGSGATDCSIGAFEANAVAQAYCPAESINRCYRGASGKFSLKDNTDDTKDQASWTWKKGPALTQAQFGDPTVSTSFAFCVYDDDALKISAQIPADASLWTKATTKGFKYKDKAGSHGGVTKIGLGGGSDGKSKVSLKAKGLTLPSPASGTQFFTDSQFVDVQLRDQNGACYESRFATPAAKNLTNQFKAKF